MFRTSLRETRLGQLRAVLSIQIPYHVFAVSGSSEAAVLLAIDAISGDLDLYRFDDGVPAMTNYGETPERVIPVALSVELAKARLAEKALRMKFLRGFYKVRHAALDCAYTGTIQLPYWVGLYERRDRVKVEVIDACRGAFEGAKIREVVGESIYRFASDRAAQPAVEGVPAIR
ncbi:MAG: PPC domain-containing protein [Acidobacteriota bacterium]